MPVLISAFHYAYTGFESGLPSPDRTDDSRDIVELDMGFGTFCCDGGTGGLDGDY